MSLMDRLRAPLIVRVCFPPGFTSGCQPECPATAIVAWWPAQSQIQSQSQSQKCKMLNLHRATINTIYKDHEAHMKGARLPVPMFQFL